MSFEALIKSGEYEKAFNDPWYVPTDIFKNQEVLEVMLTISVEKIVEFFHNFMFEDEFNPEVMRTISQKVVDAGRTELLSSGSPSTP